jgi:D-alanine-D-alanine ligase
MKNIAIVCGGNSGEYEISIASGKMAAKNIDPSKYRPYLVEIKGREWNCILDDGTKYPVDKTDFSLLLKDEKIKFDAVFNAIHGTPGEDGKLLGYLDMLGIPYSSCSVDVSALSFNKYLFNHFVHDFGIKTAKAYSFLKGESINKKEIIRELGFPMFIKPSSSGSSVGVTKVKSEAEFDGAVEKAFLEDNRVLIEEMLAGHELCCGLVKRGEELLVFPLTEIIPENEFFDYEAKYSGRSQEITPADIPEEISIDIKTISSFLYRKMDCKGFVRFDYIATETDLYLLELNTIPGMTKNSILPQQARALGLTDQELFTLVLDNLFDS